MSEPNISWLSAMTRYIEVLTASLAATAHAADRSRYRDHLAAAAQLVPLLQRGDRAPIAEWVESETHSWGWDYLSGDEGGAAEHAFVELTEELSHDR